MPDGTQNQSLYDRLLKRLKNNRIVVAILLVALAVGGAARFRQDICALDPAICGTTLDSRFGPNPQAGSPNPVGLGRATRSESSYVSLDGTTWTGSRKYVKNGFESPLRLLFNARGQARVEQMLQAGIGGIEPGESVVHYCTYTFSGSGKLALHCPYQGSDAVRIYIQNILDLSVDGFTITGTMTEPDDPDQTSNVRFDRIH